MSGESNSDGSSVKDNFDGGKMAFTAHLEELRLRLIKSAVAVVLCFIPCYMASQKLFLALSLPLINAMPEGGGMSMLTPQEGFLTNLEVSFFAAVFIAFPFIVYQVWKFTAPGLYAHEKNLVWPFVAAATFFFVLGASFAYFAVFPIALKFLLGYAADGHISANISMQSYLGFVTKLLLAFGLVFELPVVVFFLAKMGLTTHRPLARARPYAIVIVFIAAAILTPPDVVSQIMMAIPLYVLYEISIVVARMASPGR